MKRLMEFFRAHKEVVTYLFFGVLTTVVDLVVFALLNNWMHMAEVPATVLSQLVAMTFAYVTNKLWVFESKTDSAKAFFKEMLSFYACRIAGALFSVLYMWLLVELPNWGEAPWAIATIWFLHEFHWYSFLMKAIASVIVIVANYIASKLWIFRKRKKSDAENEEEL